jgi:flagellar motility protein MotE (MotC chaperone)
MGDEPVSKKQIIMIAAAGLISFVGAFVLALLTKPITASQADEFNQPTPLSQETETQLIPPESDVTEAVDVSGGGFKNAMPEKQLKGLVYEVREKIREYNGKLDGLKVREQRLQIAQDTLKKDIEELSNLRIELATMVASLQERWDRLLKTRVKIAQAEKVNLVSIAATYDKMDAASASKILTNICASSRERAGGFDSRDSGLDDAVKILYYMSERTKAKLLAELVTSEPKLAAALCQRLKEIIEE